MEWNFLFFINSVLFGVGLAMDAFSVSLANGLNEPKMPAGRMCTIAGVFAFFQIIMPLIGWFCVRTVAETFTAFQRSGGGRRNCCGKRIRPGAKPAC